MARVKRVIDGDTFETSTGEIVRLANVNAPEVGLPFSRLATDHLKDLVEGRPVRLRRVARDRYGRSVAEVKQGQKNVNRSMKCYLTRRRNGR